MKHIVFDYCIPGTRLGINDKFTSWLSISGQYNANATKNTFNTPGDHGTTEYSSCPKCSSSFSAFICVNTAEWSKGTKRANVNALHISYHPSRIEYSLRRTDGWCVNGIHVIARKEKMILLAENDFNFITLIWYNFYLIAIVVWRFIDSVL